MSRSPGDCITHQDGTRGRIVLKDEMKNRVGAFYTDQQPPNPDEPVYFVTWYDADQSWGWFREGDFRDGN